MNAAAAAGAPGVSPRVEHFSSTVVEMAACRARVGVAPRPDLAVDQSPADAQRSLVAERRGPGSWRISDERRTLVVRPAAERGLPSAQPCDVIVLSIVGPRMRRLLRSCGASAPAIGAACRTTIGTLEAWVLTEAAEHALVVIDAADALPCCEILGAQGSTLGCVFVGQPALHRLAAAHVVTLS